MNALKTSVYVSVILCPLSFALAEEAKTESIKELKAKVVSVRGIAKKMQANQKDAKWTPLKADETLSQYAVVRTGFNSQVVLHFTDRGEVTIESGTKVGISQFTEMQGGAGTIKANLGLKYGSMRLKVDRSRGANDFSVSTPVATLSVRGTEGWLSFFADLGGLLFGNKDTWSYRTGGRERLVTGKQKTNDNLDRNSDIDKDNRDVGLGDPSGQTDNERRNLRDYNSGRGFFASLGSAFTALNKFISECHGSSGYEQPPYPNGEPSTPYDPIPQ